MKQPLKLCRRCGKHGNPIPVDEYNKVGPNQYEKTKPKVFVCEFCGWKVRL